MSRSQSDSGRALRIVHIVTRLVNGGADENTVLSCNYAVKAGHRVTLVHGAVTRPEILATLHPDVELVALPSLVRHVAPWTDVRAMHGLTRLIRRLGPDVVHTHTSKAGVLGRLAARRAGVPVIVHGVHIVPFENVGRVKRVAYRTAERAVAGKTHAFVDVSAGVRDLCIAAGVGGPDRHHIVRSGFDVAGFRDATPPPEWRELLGLRAQGRRPPVVVMVAAFEPRKRHLELLDRLPALVEAFPDIRVVFVGDGVLRSQVEERISSLGLDRNVVLTGFRRDPERYIALADVCLLTSRREGLPRVVLQYLAAGKPVVATDLPGIREVLSENANSLIVPVNDLDALAQATAHLLGDDADRARLAAGAAATDLSEWDARRMAGKLDEIYGAVLRRRPPASGAAYPRALSPT